MASIHPKKVAAAVAAVLQHAALVESPFEAAAPSGPVERLAAPALPPLWGWAGRQEAMQARVAWQRRLAKSW